jgi:hypothetical protein
LRGVCGEFFGSALRTGRNRAVRLPAEHSLDCDLSCKLEGPWNGTMLSTILQNVVFAYGTEEERMLDWGIHCAIIQS